jgi:hypothetical protein
MRLNGGNSAAFLSIFLASGFHFSQTGFTPAHTQVTQTVRGVISKVLLEERYNVAKQTNKDQLLKDIHTERRRLEKNLSALSAEDMIQPGVTGTWSVKDILAHLVAWERLFLDWYHTGMQGRSPAATPVGMSQGSMDTLNQQIYEANRWRSLDDIIAEFHVSYQQIVTVIETIPEEDMFVQGRFHWTGKLTLADYIVGNTCNHYAWAKSQIRKRAKHEASAQDGYTNRLTQ